MLQTRWTLKVGIGGLFYLLAALLYPFEMVFRYQLSFMPAETPQFSIEMFEKMFNRFHYTTLFGIGLFLTLLAISFLLFARQHNVGLVVVTGFQALQCLLLYGDVLINYLMRPHTYYFSWYEMVYSFLGIAAHLLIVVFAAVSVFRGRHASVRALKQVWYLPGALFLLGLMVLIASWLDMYLGNPLSLAASYMECVAMFVFGWWLANPYQSGNAAYVVPTQPNIAPNTVIVQPNFVATFCPNCGRRLTEQEKFCSECGCPRPVTFRR